MINKNRISKIGFTIDEENKKIITDKIILKLNKNTYFSFNERMIYGDLYEIYNPIKGLIFKKNNRAVIAENYVGVLIKKVINIKGINFFHALRFHRSNDELMSGTIYENTSLKLKGINKPFSLINGDEIYYGQNGKIKIIKKVSYFKKNNQVKAYYNVYEVNSNEEIISSRIIKEKLDFETIKKYNLPIKDE